MIRLIPVLLLKGKGLVKTTKFKNPVYIGDPINAVRIFNEKEVDELVLCDIEASIMQREPNYAWIKDIVSECFMPVGYGGGIRNMEQIRKIFDLGVEKVILNTAAFDFKLVAQAASIYGNQSIVGCIDAKKSLLGGYNVYSKSGSVKYKIAPEEFTKQLVSAGAGEIIVQSIDKEGSMTGFDLELTKSVANAVNVPVVASGGAGNMLHISDVLDKGKASSVSAGSFFVFKGKHRAVLINYPKQEEIKALNQK
jgi:imidazole glycerol-phosphate synthase subunit HisF